MLRLAILRHAEAQPLTEAGDLERPLSNSGRDMAERMGRYFREAKLVPELSLVSPARRTRETFEGLEKGAGQTFPVEYEAALYNAALETLDEVVTATPKDVKFLLIVGHNPGFAEFANALAGEGKKTELSKMRTNFPTPCLAVIDFDVKSWKKAVAGEGRLDIFLTRNALAKAIAGE
ncbi:MAG TPA: histidine phosphatase family protein [Methylovirgula sp.]|jgi:phosphohistidine phosphatase